MTAPAIQPSDINLNDPERFQSGEFHELLRILRHHDPVHWNPPGEVANGFWSITKYEDILFISRNPELFISSKGIAGPGIKPEKLAELDFAAQQQNAGGNASIITMDPPRHVKMRRLVNKGFTPRAVNAMEPEIRRITNEILDRVAQKGECDFVLEVASQLPLAVICGMMGVEQKDWPLMFELTNKVLGSGDPEYQTDVPEDQRGTPEAARITGNMGTMQMFGYFAQALMARKTARTEDIISLLVDSEVDGEKLTDEDILWFCFLLILAGNETTRNAMSGGLLALCEHPEQKKKLLNDMSLIDSAVEEILRWVSPVTHMARVAKEDTAIRHQPIRAGERVVMWYPSVNRDEDVFPNADVFDITRTPNDHLAFGIGEHFCLGAGFARLELKVLFQELFRRFPDIDLAGPPQRLRSTFIGGIKHLPVKFTPEK